MSIEQIKSNIIGKWKYQDGRVLEFTSVEDFTLTSRDGNTKTPTQKIFFKEQQNGIVTLSMPSIMEAMGVIKSVSQDKIVYNSMNLDGTKNEMVLTRS